ncbi:hypothetical protein [Cystobacter fuscus]|uniref:hypothetical protein n=1 Tax=Cystobacter fuscus TaxID=43 RepID=UPI0037C18813
MSGIGIDEVFTAGNGPTYAVTRFSTHPAGAPDIAARVELDIRDALGHHGVAWEGTTEGLVGGKGSPAASRRSSASARRTSRYSASSVQHWQWVVGWRPRAIRT